MLLLPPCRANDEQWTVSKPYAHAAPAKTRVLIRQDDDALGGAGGGRGGPAAISSDVRLPAPRVRSDSAGELLTSILRFHPLATPIVSGLKGDPRLCS